MARSTTALFNHEDNPFQLYAYHRDVNCLEIAADQTIVSFYDLPLPLVLAFAQQFAPARGFTYYRDHSPYPSGSAAYEQMLLDLVAATEKDKANG